MICDECGDYSSKTMVYYIETHRILLCPDCKKSLEDKGFKIKDAGDV